MYNIVCIYKYINIYIKGYSIGFCFQAGVILCQNCFY